MKESRKEFIKELHEEVSFYWKERIEKEFPELFENKLEVGKWYKGDLGHLYFLDKIVKCPYNPHLSYGFDLCGEWSENTAISLNHPQGSKYTEATDKEVEEALINEAKKRGYKNGNHACLTVYVTCKNIKENAFFYYNGSLWEGNSEGNNCIFRDGKWAEIIEAPEKELTKEQVEKELGYKIKIV